MTNTVVLASWKTELKQMIDSTYHLDLEVEGRWRGNLCIHLEKGTELLLEGEQAQYARDLIDEKHDQEWEETLGGLTPEEAADILSLFGN